MSQSDYIKYKRVGTQLRIDSSWNKIPPVLEPQQYIDYKQYALENAITNTKLIYNTQTPSGDINVFGMNKTTGGCPTFITCSNTNQRPNRVALSTVYFTPTPQPLNIKQQIAAEKAKEACKCPYVNPISQPTNIVATDGVTTVAVAFTSATTSDGSTITNYQYSTDGGSTFTACSPATTTSPITISGLTTGQTYSIVIRAVSTSTASGTPSLPVSATPYTIPGTPTSLVGTGGNTTASISFTTPSSNGRDITNYQYSTNGGSTFTACSPAITASPILITGLTNGQAYTIKLKAVNAAGASVASASVTVTPYTVPGAPTSLSATAGNNKATIAFTTPASNGGNTITNYQYSTDDGSTYTACSPATTTSPIVITGLTNDQAYTIKLKAVNAGGAGTASSSVSVTPKAFTPLAGSLVYDGSSKVNLSPGVALGSGAYTVECWLYNNGSWPATPTTQPNLGLLGCAVHSELYGMNLMIVSNSKILIDINGGFGTLNYTFATPFQTNTWYHFVLVRNSSMIETVFMNGVKASSATGLINGNPSGGQQTNTTNYTGHSDEVGRSYQGNWTGYLTNFRMVAGTAIYDPTASSITTPNAPLTAVTNTQYLMLGSSVTGDAAGVQTVTNSGVTQSSSAVPF